MSTLFFAPNSSQRRCERQDETGGGGSGTVLDMHTQQGKKGVRFEDPHWWSHLPALKPIGLTCLLTEKISEVKRR